jgi:hypothetical protein
MNKYIAYFLNYLQTEIAADRKTKYLKK